MANLSMKMQKSMGITAAPSRRGVRQACASKPSDKEDGPAEIYLGFPKGDYDRSTGRKGRVIQDDPSKYPDRVDLGPFRGAVGGWAGGEAALSQLVDEIKEEQKNGTTATGPGLTSPLRPPSKNKWGVRTGASGKDPIYLGFAKDEIELRKTGIQGRVIYDESYKYPDREDRGFFKGLVGGFAGGEPALRDFAETGELKLRKPGDPVKKQFSPLVLAFLVAIAAAGGGILITTALSLGDEGLAEIAAVSVPPGVL